MAEADRLGRSAVLDLPDEETVESADATPGADGDAADGETPHRRRLRRFAARASQLEGQRRHQARAARARPSPSCCSTGYNPIVFCRFIDTAEYVAEHLAQAPRRRLRGRRRHRRRCRRTSGRPGSGTWPGDRGKRPVLVATDCLSEGVNLQEHFQAVVHYDLAWNPTRHEQREGRVDRFGQQAAHRPRRHALRRGQRHRRHRPGRAAPQARADPQGPGHLRPGAGPQRRRGAGDPRRPAAARRARRAARARLGLEQRDDLHREWDSAAAQGTPVPHQVRAGRHPARRGRPRTGRDARQPRHRRRRRGLHRRGAARPARRRHPAAGRIPRRDRRAARRPARRAGPRPRRAAAVPPRPAGAATATPTWTAPTRTSPRSPATCWSPRSTR